MDIAIFEIAALAAQERERIRAEQQEHRTTVEDVDFEQEQREAPTTFLPYDDGMKSAARTVWGYRRVQG